MSRDLIEDISHNVRMYIDKLGISQKELASKANMPQPMISRILNGKQKAGLTTITKLAKAFNIPIYELILSQKYEQRYKDFYIKFGCIRSLSKEKQKLVLEIVKALDE